MASTRNVNLNDLCLTTTGVRSRNRACVAGNAGVAPVPFAEFNYRAMIPSEAMMRDSETAQLMASSDTQAWFGPGRFVVGYPISNGKLFNLAMVAPRVDDTPVTNWNQPGDVSELRSLFQDFCPLVQKLTMLVEKCAKWTIAEIPLLKTWSSQSGKTVLLGDAAHAMSPHAAQGGAMALEDAAVLGEVLSCLTAIGDLPRAVKAYEEIRKPRISRIRDIAKGNGAAWMLPDGPKQMTRDRRFKTAMDDYLRHLKENGREEMVAKFKADTDINTEWPRPAVLMWLYGYNTFGEIRALE